MRYFILAISILSGMFTCLYGQWEILNEGGSFESIYFVNNKIGWIAGDGTLLKTENGGETWHSIMGGDALYFAEIDFINESVGWAIVWVEGNDFKPSIQKTENGGQSWTIQKEFNDVYQPRFCDVTVYVVNDSIVYAAGSYNRMDEHELWMVKTVDGGLTWIDIAPFDNGRTFHSSWFQDSNRGILLGSPVPEVGQNPDESIILKTIDAGETWDEKIISEFTNMNDLQIINDSTAYFLGTKGTIDEPEYYLCKTTDNLNSWTRVAYNDHFITSFYCLDKDTIIATAYDDTSRYLIKSIDGGLTWDQKHNPGIQSGEICFINEDVGFIAGAALGGNFLFKTTDGGDSWDIDNFSYPLSDIYPVDENKVFVSGGYIWIGGFAHSSGAKGALFFTNNNGKSWKNTFALTDLLNSCQFVNADIGFISCRNRILKTTDGGDSWNSIFENDIYSLGYGFIGNDMCFLNEDIGWAVGRYFGIEDSLGAWILGTTDGGQNWDLNWKYPNTDVNNYNLGSIHASNATAWAVGDGGLIVKYSEQNQWQPITGVTDLPLNDVFFIDENQGWIAGGFSNNNDFQSILLKTSDGGQTWIEKRFANFLVNDLYFADSLHGWAVGGDRTFYTFGFGWPMGNGVILNTIDGGENWTLQIENFSAPIAAIHFENGFGWAVGGNGLVLRYDGTTWVNHNTGEIYANNFNLWQNHPNPFNPITAIEYQIPNSEDVTLKIYNLIGQEAATLVSERQQAGYHQVKWNAAGYASGVYFYAVKAGEFVQVKKMILLR